jgi:hypothetical protein
MPDIPIVPHPVNPPDSDPLVPGEEQWHKHTADGEAYVPDQPSEPTFGERLFGKPEIPPDEKNDQNNLL